MAFDTAKATLQTQFDLVELVSRRELEQPGYWDFTDSPRRGGSHAFFQYPAMMVPELQGALLDDLLAADASVQHVFDPFMGSGTVLLESIFRGLDFHGVDINPMATLLSHVKATPPTEQKATKAVTRVLARAQTDRGSATHTFSGIDKWFQSEVRADLDRLRRSIQEEPSLEVRRFLWVCLAETVRLVSNSRTSTVKLHTYSTEDLASRKPKALDVFRAIGNANAGRAGEHWKKVESRDRTVRARAPKVQIQRSSILSDIVGPRTTDAIMTSPPYGDNDTTVPYGQHSFLPLQWIDHADLVSSYEPDLLSSTGRIDTLSLGGSLRGALTRRTEIEGRSTALKEFLTKLDDRNDLLKKVISFSFDYDRALGRATKPLKSGGFAFWTLGERRVGGHPVPLVKMTEEFLANRGHTTVLVIDRVLPQKRKRMAATNSSGATMSKEHILITRKAPVAP